jgi:phage-related protein
MNALLNISNLNLLEFSNMEDWVNGTSAAPTDHTLSGASATVAQESTIVKRGTYSAKVTRVGADVTLYYDYSGYSNFLGRQMTFGAWVYATVASRARLSIGDGVGTTNSSYHTGDSTWQFLTVTRNIDASATRIRAGMEVNTGNTSGYFDGGILVEGSTTFTDLSSYLEDWKPSKKYRMSRFTVARRPGLIIPSSEHDSVSLKMQGKVYGSTPTVARTNFDAMLQALSGSEKDLYLYDDRFIRVYLESQDHEYIAALRCIKFNLSFSAQVPFQLFCQKYRSQQAIASSPTSFTVTNNGSVFSKPKITFVAGGSDITSCTIENLTTGQLWTFTGTVTAGNSLIIDFDAVTLTNNGVDSVANSVGDYPQFRLDPGGNILKFTGSNCTIKVDWYDRWL